MKKIIAFLMAVLMVSAMFVACGGEKETETLVFGTNAEFPPFEFIAANGVIGQYDGIDIAIADKIAKDNGMKAEISNMEFDSLLIALENGQVDAVIAGMTVKPDRAEKVDFSISYYKATQVMIVKEGSTIAKASDMADKRIAVIQGYTGESIVSDMGYKYTSFKKGTDAIMELVNDKADVVVIDSATAGKYVADNKGLKIVEDASAFANEEYAIAVKKGNKDLLDKINASLKKMLDDGTIAALGDKYAVASDEESSEAASSEETSAETSEVESSEVESSEASAVESSEAASAESSEASAA
ncbi:MAG: transporter substrate-binding domain-containing protein [Clostridia bacterium]|nr:transporter substrate-binding domain-containing protein [Clostridia bacterium]